MKNLNLILKSIIILIFLVSFSATITIYTIMKKALSEKTFTTAAENKTVMELTYNEFIKIMSSDFVNLFAESIPEQDIESAFKSAYPEEKFKTELKELLKTISKYLRDEVNSPNHALNLVEFRKNVSSFLKSRADMEKKTESKQLLLKYSNVLLNYPDNFPMLRLDDIEHIDEMKENLSRLKSIFTPFLVIALISLIILLFNPRLLAFAFLLAGITNAIGTFAVRGIISNALAKNPEPARTIASIVASETISAVFVISIILIAVGIIILSIKRKNQGGK